MKTVVLILMFVSGCLLQSQAQIGRHELPLDTVPIGGQQQQVQEDKMEGQDDLVNSLVVLRDSVASLQDSETGRNNSGSTSSDESLTVLHKKLNSVIASLQRSERDEAMLKKGYALRDEVRIAIRQTRRDAEPQSR